MENSCEACTQGKLCPECRQLTHLHHPPSLHGIRTREVHSCRGALNGILWEGGPTAAKIAQELQGSGWKIHSTRPHGIEMSAEGQNLRLVRALPRHTQLLAVIHHHHTTDEQPEEWCNELALSGPLEEEIWEKWQENPPATTPEMELAATLLADEYTTSESEELTHVEFGLYWAARIWQHEHARILQITTQLT